MHATTCFSAAAFLLLLVLPRQVHAEAPTVEMVTGLGVAALNGKNQVRRHHALAPPVAGPPHNMGRVSPVSGER